ncbi:MAG: hypothetical protein IT384_26710 [Deltaproteobacteria bacterium]|nr:hypothetical protein [Deltaproteobacteria bacterium]
MAGTTLTMQNFRQAQAQVMTTSDAFFGSFNPKTNQFEGGVQTPAKRAELDQAWASFRKAYDALPQQEKDLLAAQAREAKGGIGQRPALGGSAAGAIKPAGR